LACGGAFQASELVLSNSPLFIEQGFRHSPVLSGLVSAIYTRLLGPKFLPSLQRNNFNPDPSTTQHTTPSCSAGCLIVFQLVIDLHSIRLLYSLSSCCLPNASEIKVRQEKVSRLGPKARVNFRRTGKACFVGPTCHGRFFIRSADNISE